MSDETDSLPAKVVSAEPMLMREPQLPALPQEMSIEQVIARVEKVRELQRRVMKVDVHYGVIPGTPKPTLYKAGAELMLLTFMLDPQYTHEIVQQGDHREITSKCTLFHIPTERRVGSGEGSCSTKESKYAYRKSSSLCPACGKEVYKSKQKPEWYCWAKRGGCGKTYPLNDPRIKSGGRVPNPDLADQYNTVLKMANKRALTAAVLNATAASEIFTMDVEDFPENQDMVIEEAESEPPPPPKPEPKPEPPPRAPKVEVVPDPPKPKPQPPREPGEDRKPISQGQVNLLFAVLRGAKLVNGEDAVQAIDWLANHYNAEVVYEDGKTSTENLTAMLRQLYSDQVTDLKNAIQKAGKDNA